MSALVEVRDICKVYNPGENEVRALDHVSLTINKGEFVVGLRQIYLDEYAGLPGCSHLGNILSERKGCIKAQ